MIVALAAPAKVGMAFTSRTTTLKLLVTEPTRSLTATTMTFVDGPWASVGVQAITPFVTTRPVGPASSVTVRDCTGTSLSCGARF